MFEIKKNTLKNPLSDIQKNNIYLSLDEASKNGFIKIKDIKEIQALITNTFWNMKHFDKKLSYTFDESAEFNRFPKLKNWEQFLKYGTDN